MVTGLPQGGLLCTIKPIDSDKDLNPEALKSASSTETGDGKNEEQCDQV